ncbi:hypothetical protein [Corynebacterium aquilae]|uniref:hypothetical protein n=1 Tax=Corynebacterium aquilae TaxID=203263 RepID=UPI0009530111|nr:hypothetical protein [Corynebacterium aquilae]
MQLHSPFTVVTLLTTGIHPSTSRVVGVDALRFDSHGQLISDFFAVVNPGEDIGPVHLHSLTPAQVGRAKKFASIQSELAELIDGSTLIVHNGPRTWGFLCTEAHRAADAARHRRRGRRRVRPQKRFAPDTIVDTLASLRRQGIELSDTRIAGCARSLGLDVDPTASAARAEQSAQQLARANTWMVWWLFRRATAKLDPEHPFAGTEAVPTPQGMQLLPAAAPAPPAPKQAPAAPPAHRMPTPADLAAQAVKPQQPVFVAPAPEANPHQATHPVSQVPHPGGILGPGTLSIRHPNDLSRDKFGLQRTTRRVKAATARRRFDNPGIFDGQLVQGMEIVIAPEITVDPNDVVAAIMDNGMAYSEKLSRQTSLVVCNVTDPDKLQGKAMHGDRKGIPRVSDVEFLQLARNVAPGREATATTL